MSWGTEKLPAVGRRSSLNMGLPGVGRWTGFPGTSAVSLGISGRRGGAYFPQCNSGSAPGRRLQLLASICPSLGVGLACMRLRGHAFLQV